MRLRFTIRDLLWLTLVVATGVGWWLDRDKLNRRHDADIRKIAFLERRSASPQPSLNQIPPRPKGTMLGSANIEKAMRTDLNEMRSKTQNRFLNRPDVPMPSSVR